MNNKVEVIFYIKGNKTLLFIRAEGKDKQMDIELNGEQRLITVRPEGELDHHTAAAVKEAAERGLRRTGAISIAFDFSDVTFMDSSGIGMIMGRYKTVKALGGEIILCGMNRETERIVKMSGLEKIARIR